MEIVYHIGAHCTDDNLLIRSLRLNAGTLAKQGILVPAPEGYFSVLRDGMRRFEDVEPDRDMQQAMLGAIVGELRGQRLILSHENLICFPPFVFARNGFYDRIGAKARALRRLFPENPVEIFLGLRDPATLVPALYDRLKQNKGKDAPTPAEFLASVNRGKLSWLPVIEDLRAALPDCTITTWCNEDTPLLWPELMQTVTACAPGTKLSNDDAVLKALLTEEGLTRMRGYLEARPPSSPAHRRQVALAFFDKFGRQDALEVQIGLEGWDEAITDALSEAYDLDVARIAELPGVRFLQ